MILPEASLPIAEPSPEVVTYHARTSDLVDDVVSCEMIDLSDISRVQELESSLNSLTLQYFGKVRNRLQ